MSPRARAIGVLVAAVVGVVVMLRLGIWQLDRAAQKQAVLDAAAARATLPPLGADALARDAAGAALQHERPVRLRGRWAADRTVLIDNRPHEGRAGFIVVTPLVLARGDAVLVQRGWLARDPADARRVPPLRTPTGEVAVDGRVVPPPSKLFELATPQGPAGVIRQNLDLADFARETGLVLLPLSVQQTGPADDSGLVRAWPQVGSDVDKNRGYALQWFSFAALIAGLYVWFQLIRPRRARG